jgi:hypothetical protein
MQGKDMFLVYILPRVALGHTLSIGIRNYFSWGQRVWNMKLTVSLYVAPWLRMRGAVPPLPNMPSVLTQRWFFL